MISLLQSFLSLLSYSCMWKCLVSSLLIASSKLIQNTHNELNPTTITFLGARFFWQKFVKYLANVCHTSRVHKQIEQHVVILRQSILTKDSSLLLALVIIPKLQQSKHHFLESTIILSKSTSVLSAYLICWQTTLIGSDKKSPPRAGGYSPPGLKCKQTLESK